MEGVHMGGSGIILKKGQARDEVPQKPNQKCEINVQFLTMFEDTYYTYFSF